MFRKIRFVLVKSAHSKEGLDDKTPDQPKPEKPKSKNKFLGLFHSSSDPDLDSKSKTRKSFLRRKKNHAKENKDSQDEAVSEILPNHTERLPDNLPPDNLLPDGSLPDGSLPEGSLPDGQLPNGQLPNGQLPDKIFPDDMDQDKVLVENNVVDNFENTSQKNSVLDETSPLDPLKSMSVSTLDSMQRVDRIDFDPLPPDGEAWERAKDVWEKNEIEGTKEKDKEKRRTKGKKEHRDKKREGKEEKDGKSRHRSKSREKDKEHAGKERSDSKTRSKDKKRHEKHEHDDGKQEEKRSKDDKHKKHKSRGEKHGGGHKRDTSGGYDSDSELEHKHERKTDRKHKHKHEHHDRHKNDSDHDRTHEHAQKHGRDGTLDRAQKHARDGTLDRAHAKEHKHHDRSKHKDDKPTKTHEEHHKHKEPKTEHKHTKEHTKTHHVSYAEHVKNLPNPYADNAKQRSPYTEHKKQSSPQADDHKRIELDKVWREYESGKRYHAQEKDMKKIIDRLDGVERFRREERNRMSDRSHDRSSDTSYEATHRSRSRERRRRSRSREKHRHESDQDSNHSSTWQYSLTRIEARQEQCKAEIDTARRSIEHRIKQLETRFEKHYSSSERLPEHPREKSSAENEEPRNYKKIIDQVADECREVTRTLEVRTEEMKSEIATVVREELTHLDEKLHSPTTTPSSPGSFFGVRVVGNFRCEETPTINPVKVTRDDDNSKLTASVTSVEPISSADESMVTVIEENSRITRGTTPKDCGGAESLSPPSSRDSPVRVSQSGALDTLTEPPGQKHSVSSTCDSGISADHPTSPLHLGSPGIDDLHELSALEGSEDEEHCDGPHEEEGHDCDDTQQSLQVVYRRKIKETEARCQERALEEKEILYRRIDELESMLLASREGKSGQYV